jgi:hypothetical protein
VTTDESTPRNSAPLMAPSKRPRGGSSAQSHITVKLEPLNDDNRAHDDVDTVDDDRSPSPPPPPPTQRTQSVTYAAATLLPPTTQTPTVLATTLLPAKPQQQQQQQQTFTSYASTAAAPHATLMCFPLSIVQSVPPSLNSKTNGLSLTLLILLPMLTGQLLLFFCLALNYADVTRTRERLLPRRR